MLDPALIRTETPYVRERLAARGIQPDFEAYLADDAGLHETRAEVEQLRAERKTIARAVAALDPDDPAAGRLRADGTAVAERLTALTARQARLETACRAFLDALPNLPDPDVPAGGKEANRVLRTAGDPPVLPEGALDHVTLATRLGLVDYERGVRIAGTGFWAYRGSGARLEWALLNYFLDAHIAAGYEFVLPPHLATVESVYTAGQYPKFADDLYPVGTDGREQEVFLLPTAETALANLHRGEILAAEDLPLQYVAYTPCYRQEAGGYRTAERGTLRGHQFNKVELFCYTTPENSDALHEALIARAEALVAGFGLHYRVTQLAAGDTSAAMARTVDIEVYLPSLKRYVEVSSVSNARDYQARRGGVRYRTGRGKPRLVHTLNGSGLATSRLLPAICEQFQQADGTVAVPEVLRRWTGTDTLRMP
ncbi:serine--tRNA ligase [Actinospica sp. MGRD01-02]|uniref:Serine--tRNA ligase n=1 Tax=Actinospica acidithermotolerans TaxID=2828514 RepID=A0A941IMW4_9ACTN|nr:serine--tRNA ligase [Actinospica acidithermotolerans]MBR7830413.1 serine--tRNA ligase [Actinospica acidithermotolerans]